MPTGRLFALVTAMFISLALPANLAAQSNYERPYVFTTLAGRPTFGHADGTGTAARFYGLAAIAVDGAGNTYVSDSNNYVIRKITPAGVVSTFAGSVGNSGGANGPGTAARFTNPAGIVVDPAGNLYVADNGNNTIRKVTPAAVVSFLAGGGGISGALRDGTGAEAQFSGLTGLAIDAAGNLYVADSFNNAVRKVTPTGVVTTLAGNGDPGTADGTGSAARFTNPTGLAFDSAGDLYVADRENHAIRKITPAGVVSTVAGHIDGLASAARFASPQSLAFDAAGNLYITDVGDYTIRKITPAGVVSTFAGLADSPSGNNGVAESARFFGPAGIAFDGTRLLVADAYSVRQATLQAEVATLAGPDGGSVDGTGLAARFSLPRFLVLDRDGDLIVADTFAHTIRRITPSGVVSTIAGLAGTAGSADGVGSNARFNTPRGVACDASGNIYVSDTGNQTIRRISANGQTSTLAGTPGMTGSTDGPGSAARFNLPWGLVSDTAGNLYVADSANHTVRKISADGAVSTFAGQPGAFGGQDGTGSSARLLNPRGLAIDGAGNLYLATGGSTIRKISPSAEVTTIAGANAQSGSVDAIGTAARFNHPQGITVDGEGTLFVADSNNNLVRRIATSAAVTSLAGLALTEDYADGTGSAAHFVLPIGIAVARSGILYVADVNGTIRRGVPAGWTPPTVPLTWTPPAAISYGTALTAVQLNATATVPGTFVYAPVAGTVLDIGRHSLTATFTPTDTLNYATTSIEVSLNVLAEEAGGTYFGTFPNNHGRWALKVNSDKTAVYVAYLTARNSAVVVRLTVNTDGTFAANGAEIVPLSVSAGVNSRARSFAVNSTARPLAATTFTLSGQITSSGTVTGQLTGLGETFSGTIDSTAGSAASGSYTAAALNTASGATYAIVAPSGQAFVLVVSTTIDSASGTVGSNNQLTATTASGGQLSLTLNSSAHSLAATVTPAGSTTPISFAGLSDTTASTAHLVNIAARAFCSTDNRVTIGGFVISGSVAKRVLVRAVGPSLTAQGIGAAEVLLDPTIEVHDALHGNSVIAANDNWADNDNAADITAAASAVGAAALLGTDTKSSALLLDLVPGVYSFIVNGKAATSGIVLLEVYDADTTSAGSTFANIATRAFATTGNGVTIGGFVLSGNAPKHVLLRAVGPTLATQGLGVTEVLTDPTIELHDALNGNAVIATNDNWGDNANAAAITTTGARIGATPFDGSDAKSAALLLTLQPGVYSFIASGKPSAPSGIVLVEVYDAD